ncbi:VanZ family protein [Arthrobacter sp. Soc17.1.1.1]|uniref:VanZ family protein n=1 Tax=Arthrobacter sp. Soc17.1.1.1 TaxID=3121277 RepID=UPI002FE46E1B
MSTAPLPSTRYRTVTAGLCAAWLVAVALIVLWPTPVDRAGGPLLQRALAYLYTHGLPAFVTYSSVEFLSNVLMFAPLGLFWFILIPRGWRWAGPLAGMVLSLLIEGTQALLLPQRVATPDDVLANTIGAVCGTLVAWMLVSARHRRRTS